MSKTTEIVRRIWDDNDGICLEVRPDPDGSGTIEIITPDDRSKEWFGTVRFALDAEMALHLGEALIAASKEISK